uniref:AlNc14C451G11727 protein n=1 Tax=Albugo laibachii Nc14 TaxID=890382 RepID=F0WZY4_9STRA|nr:AlNc14C451G11727 [Albugo laibachii Nc14]|eukprot:CCA27065.1 AlNc14C451G11727 [Albugo laibachii Nc14]
MPKNPSPQRDSVSIDDANRAVWAKFFLFTGFMIVLPLGTFFLIKGIARGTSTLTILPSLHLNRL